MSITKAQDIIDRLPPQEFPSFHAYQERNGRAILAAGFRCVKAIEDNAGNCITCGESGRCPGYHTTEEFEAALTTAKPSQ